MDTHAFASLAHVRVLLLAVGNTCQATFDKYAADIRSFSQIRLGDIPDDSRDERSRFMPKPLSEGHLHLSFPTHPPPRSHAPLSLITPSHFPLAVIGISEKVEADPLHSIYTQFHTQLAQLFPPGALFPLAKNCFVFERGETSANLNPGDNLPGMTIIPGVMGNKKLYIGTLLADICSNVLGGFGTLVQTLESPLGNEYLNASLLPALPSLSEIPSPLSKNNKRDSLPPLPSVNSQPEISRTSSPFTSAPSMKRTTSSGVNRQSTLGVPAAKKRASGIGAASSHGRLFKIFADFFLLAGRTEDAIIWYNEAITLFKTNNDPIWHASALEGLALISVLDAWSAGHGLNASISSNKQQPWIEVADRLQQATSLYSTKFPGGDTEQYCLISYMYCDCVLRYASLLFAVWSAKGWGPLAFTTMLHPGPVPYLPPTLASDSGSSLVDLERLSLISNVPRSSISAVLAQLHGPWLLHLGVRERLSILELTASMYSCLGYRRKEAYILREILGCVLDLLVCSREENPDPRSPTTADKPITNGLHGLGIDGLQKGQQGAVGVRRNESNEGNESILRLLKYTCKVLGIDLESVRIVDGNDPQSNSETQDESTAPFNEESTPEVFGWPELQVGVIREAVAIAEALPDHLAVAQFALSSLRTLQPILDPGDQNHLYTTAARALLTAKRRGETRCVLYWSGNPILNISITSLPIMRLPMEKTLSALSAKVSEAEVILTGAKDPFLYNPRRVVEGQDSTLIVENENVEFTVLLQNRYVFGLEIQSLTLSTTGVEFETKPISVTIPPHTIHQVVLSGKPLRPGTLTVRGCLVQAPGGASREFVLPLCTEEEEERVSRSKTSLACEYGRFKYSGLETFPWAQLSSKRSSGRATKNIVKYLSCNVVPEQPLLRIRRTSLTHGAVMMYNGETSTIRLVLENVSRLPVDFMRLSFDDSSIAPAQQALSEGELSTFETYELEYDLIHRPLFRSDNPDEVKPLLPGQRSTLEVSCYGKAACTTGTIHVSYGYIHREKSDVSNPPSEVFHTRQLSYPIMVTVYEMLECHEMSIIPYSSQSYDLLDADMVGRTDRAQVRQSFKDIKSERGWCLFSVEIRNAYGVPFVVDFERHQEDCPPMTVTTTVAPGSTSRVILPLKRFTLPADVISQPIPTLSDRQFVVAKSSLSSEEEELQRTLFWYREEVLKIVKGSWREAGGSRFGDLSLRRQSLTLTMLKALRTDVAQIQLSLWKYDAQGRGERISSAGGKYVPQQNEFVYVKASVRNLSATPRVLSIDLHCEPAQHVVHEGAVSGHAIGRLDEGEEKEIDIALCFLSEGSYQLNLDVAEGDLPVGFGMLMAIVG